jgi:hypothetical protein
MRSPVTGFQPISLTGASGGPRNASTGAAAAAAAALPVKSTVSAKHVDPFLSAMSFDAVSALEEEKQIDLLRKEPMLHLLYTASPSSFIWCQPFRRCPVTVRLFRDEFSTDARLRKQGLKEGLPFFKSGPSWQFREAVVDLVRLEGYCRDTISAAFQYRWDLIQLRIGGLSYPDCSVDPRPVHLRAKSPRLPDLSHFSERMQHAIAEAQVAVYGVVRIPLPLVSASQASSMASLAELKRKASAVSSSNPVCEFESDEVPEDDAEEDLALWCDEL